MGNKLYEENSVQAIANAIRSKLGVETTYKINEMAGAINTIVKPNGTTNITENGYHNVTAYEQAYVQVQGGITPTGTANIYENGTYDITNYAEANVAVPQPVGKTTITTNGTDIDIAQYATADVNVQPNVGTKTINQNGVYNASSDNLDGYSQVDVNVPTVPSSWTLTNITISEDCHSVTLPYDSNRNIYAVILIPNVVQYSRYEYLFYFAKRSYSHVINDNMAFNHLASVQMNSSHDDDSITTGSNTGTIDVDTTNHTITLNTRSDTFWYRRGDIFDVITIYIANVSQNEGN